MRRFFLPLFFALAIAVTATILATSGNLPERIASHFANGGAANGWMSRDAYVVIVLAMATLLPLFIVAMMARLPRMNPRRIRLPHRDYWLAPERRDAARVRHCDRLNFHDRREELFAVDPVAARLGGGRR